MLKQIIAEKELDFSESPTIKPPPVSREPSTKPPAPVSDVPAEEELVLPRDDDEYSPAHGEDDVGTGVGDEPAENDVAEAELDRAAADEEAAAVEEVLATADEPPVGKKEAS